MQLIGCANLCEIYFQLEELETSGISFGTPADINTLLAAVFA